MNKRTPTPFKRGNTWTFVLYIPDKLSGKSKAKWFGGYKTSKDASNAAKQMIRQMEDESLDSGEFLSVERYLNDWFENIHKPQLKPSTARGYDVNLRNHIIPYIGTIRMDKLARNDVTRLYNELSKKGLSPTSVKYVHNTLSKAMKDALISGIITKNPCEYATLPRQHKYKADILSPEQCRILLEKAKDTDIYLELLFAVCLGLRRGEVLGLQYRDFDFDKGMVHVQRQITVSDDEKEYGITTLKSEDSDRLLYLPEHLTEIVKAKSETAKDDWFVCGDAAGNFKNPYTLYRKYKKLLEACELPSIRFHDLRHSYATALIENNVPLKAVSHMLGHSSITITADIYCGVLNAHKDGASVSEKLYFR